jgi:sugar/nucleoside kinase (ribokinase family)
MQAVVAGHLCLDILPDLDRFSENQFQSLFLPGHLLEIGPASLSTGGSVSNTGLALHKLGISTRLIGKVGMDLFGEAVRNLLGRENPALPESLIRDPNSSTSYTIIISPPGIDRIFLHNPGANDTFSAADICFDEVAQADLFHFGYPPIMRQMYTNGGSELIAIYRRAKQAGLTTSLDMALPDPVSPGAQVNWPAILQATLPSVDIFLPSIEEILCLVYPDLYHTLSKAAHGGDILPWITPELLNRISSDLLGLGVKILVIKLGEFGAYLRTADQANLAFLGKAAPHDISAWANRELWSPCFQVNVAGTTGSGDATIAGFLSALLRNLSPERALTAAVAVGACNVERADALNGIRSWDETLTRVDQGWPHREMTLRGQGFAFNRELELWTGPCDQNKR